MTKKISCDSCFYYKDGFCFRYPPKVINDHSYYVQGIKESIITTRFPEVDKTDFCGEYRKRFNDE